MRLPRWTAGLAALLASAGGALAASAQARPSDRVTRPSQPTLLSPTEGERFTVGKPVVLMVKPPAQGASLGTVVVVRFERCAHWASGSPACGTWSREAPEARVSAAEVVAGTFLMPAKVVQTAGIWRVRVSPGDAPFDPSAWRTFRMQRATEPPSGAPRPPARSR